MVISEELNEELNQAAVATSQAYANARTASSGINNMTPVYRSMQGFINLFYLNVIFFLQQKTQAQLLEVLTAQPWRT